MRARKDVHMNVRTMKNEYCNALKEAGLEASMVETVKNGVVCNGYQIDTGERIKPVIYHSQGETLEGFVERALKIANQPLPDLGDPDNLISREKLMNNSFLCLQKKGSENIVKRDFLNLELYVRFSIDFENDDTLASTKVTQQMLEMTGVSSDELFEAAKMNSLFKASICSMAEALGLPEELFGEAPFAVGTYDNKSYGAAVLALPEVIHSYCEEKGYEKLYIIPSSIEEILLIPTDLGDLDSLIQMNKEVTESTVDEVMRLETCIYFYDDITQAVCIAERGC